MQEEWRKIQGQEYEVSNFGRVRSLTRKLWNGCGFFVKEGKILKPRPLPTGYLRVNLSHDKTYYIHRLVAEAFISNPDNLPQVNHKDENKQNNSVDNLEWCTGKYNVNYGTGRKRAAEKKRGKIINNKPILQCSRDGTIMRKFVSVTAASRETGIDNSHIGKVANGVNRTAGGFVWRWC